MRALYLLRIYDHVLCMLLFVCVAQAVDTEEVHVDHTYGRRQIELLEYHDTR